MKQHVSLPHARGGVSRTPRKYPSSRKSSPRTWGCFFPELADADPSLVFPTHVGVFLAPDSLRSETRGLPHARGGVSGLRKTTRVRKASSPRTWGCFNVLLFTKRGWRVFPTHVGVFLWRAADALPSRRLPHARGGVSKSCRCLHLSQPSSPRTWGCFRASAALRARSFVFPTHVGVFLDSLGVKPGFLRLPHARGGVSRPAVPASSWPWSSPRTWGCFHRAGR